MTSKSEDASGDGEGRISRRKLLQYAGEFDIESVHFLKLSKMDLFDISVLRESKNITRLDISHNRLSNIEAIGQLKSITFLNITANQITNIDCLAGSESLEELSAAGNLLSNTERIKCLMGLLSLKNLRLNDNINKLTNPICKMQNYHKSVLQLLPSLIVFDGERVNGRGSELYKMCCELDEQIESGRTFGPVAHRPLAEPWIKPGYFAIKEPPVGADESSQAFSELVKDCKRVVDQAALRLERFKRVENTNA
uniref:Leucine-rich repeat-containing protein 61 n=1 Tax=Phallusia mammillata TaxID=59560 RepID=A0A6F9DK60_9ASCI|nr:leucine-rich repeat-containing protein 61 [Phallusia mammillata]